MAKGNCNGCTVGTVVELDLKHLDVAKEQHADKQVEFLERDFLDDISDLGEFDYVVGNPPYVP